MTGTGFEDKKLKSERDLFYNKLVISSFINNTLIKDINISKEEVLAYYNSSKGFFNRKQEEVFVHHFFNKEIEKPLEGKSLIKNYFLFSEIHKKLMKA